MDAEHVATVLSSLAVLLVMAGGLMAIIGAKDAKGGLLRFGIFLFLAAMFIPYAVATIRSAVRTGSCDAASVGAVPTGLIVPGLIGHAALAIALIRRRLRRDSAGDRRAETLRARGRERPRLPPPEGGA
ncbi:MAG: hypothetical protein U0414_31975 [Polyangiaceae bacterium]